MHAYEYGNLVTRLPVWQSQSENEWNLVVFSFFFLFLFGKSLSYPSLALCVESCGRMLGRFQGVVEMRRFDPVDTVEYLSNLQWCRKSL